MDIVTEEILIDISKTSGQFENTVDPDNILRSAPEWKFSAGVEKFFKPAPTWQHVCVIWLLLVTGWVTNSVIIKIYWRLKSSNRVYVLAMAFMDLTNLTFVLLPRFILMFLGQSVVREVIELIRYTIGILIFNLYILLPLFLALDRFVAVTYPHKMKDYIRRLRVLKVGCIAHCCLQVVALLTTEVLFGTESVWLIVILYNTLALFVEALSALVLYVIIAVKIMMSTKRMKNHRSINLQYR